MISVNFKKLYFFCGLICLMVSLIFIFGYTARAETITIEGQLGQTCKTVCENESGFYCVGIKINSEYLDHRFCGIDYDNGGDTFCSRFVGDCNTVISDDGYAGCSNPYGDNLCNLSPDRQAQFTNCLCRTNETPILDHTNTGADESTTIGANDGQATNNFIYQPFAFPTNNIGKIMRFSTFIGTTGWNGGLVDTTDMAWFKIGFSFANSADDCFNNEVEKYINCVFGCDEDTKNDMYATPTNNGNLIASNYWELNAKEDGDDLIPIYDSANPATGLTYFCGVGIYSYKYSIATSTAGITVLTGENSNLLKSYNFFSQQETNPLSFKLYGEPPEIATTTEECNCNDIATSTGLLDDIGNGIQCAFRKITCWLFTPSADTIDNFATSTHKLSESFPFNTLYGLTNPIKESADIEMNSTSTSDLKMPMVNKSGHYYLLQVASSTSVTKLIGATNANSWRVGIAYVIWAMFAGLIFMIIF
jgi:hypothetical protein